MRELTQRPAFLPGVGAGLGAVSAAAALATPAGRLVAGQALSAAVELVLDVAVALVGLLPL